jgi:anti-anti-sigma regulatory factor
MDVTTLRVTARPSTGGGLVIAVEGYLDEEGGSTLAREAGAILAVDHRRIGIDLAAVTLFTCSGARRLIAVLDELGRRGCRVDLLGVRHPLQRLLELAA